MPLGTRKRVELARALAGSPKLLLLDEPAGGLNHEEVGELGGLIRRIRDERQVTVLLVEHHMASSCRCPTRSWRSISAARSPRARPAEVQQDPAVIEAYLGSRGTRQRAMMLEVEALDAFYGEQQALPGSASRLDEGRASHAARGQWRRQDDDVPRALPAWCAPPAGSASTASRSVGRATEDIVRLGIAHVPEGRGTFCRVTVEENLQLGAMTRRDRAGIAADIEQVYGHFPRLEERRTQQAGTLSGGEQQMLAVGRALMLRPRLMLLDEPSFGLAPLVVEELFAILRQRQPRAGGRRC